MLAQVDSDGVTLKLMDGVVDHKVNDALAVSKADKRVYNCHGRRRLHKTTIVWWLLVRWKDENEMWMKLSEMKESYPIETAEYAISRGIDDEPAFLWWVGPTLKRRKAIVAALKTQMRQTKHKYGIEIPTSIEHTKELDQKDGSDFWMKALAKEMYNVGVASQATLCGM